jgi:iron complex outermembrane receptor protein
VNQGNKVSGVPEYLINANVEWDMPFVPSVTLTGRVVHTDASIHSCATAMARSSTAARSAPVQPIVLAFKTIDNQPEPLSGDRSVFYVTHRPSRPQAVQAASASILMSSTGRPE